MALRLRGSTSGYAEIDAPAVAGDVTLTLPSTTGTINVKDASGNTEVGTGVNLGNPGANIFTINNTGGERLRIAADGTVSIPGALNVSGVLTYEDVTSVDAIGLSTFRDGLNTKDVGITTISTSVSDTAVDVFIYDTSKDSDGGEWRKRTSHTSWYNETLNTATRGSRREFPAVAVIVAEATKVTIYDGDDPDLPMWMIVTGSNNDYAIETEATSIFALNGVLSIGCGGSGFDLYLVKFLEDAAYEYSTGGYRKFVDNIATRSSSTRVSVDLTLQIIDRKINDVAMTVLPNAPIDDATGLPVPTIAVGTDGGVSVIKDDGTVVDIINSNSGYRKNLQVKFTTDNKVVYTETSSASEYGWMYIHEIPSSDETITINTKDTALGWYDTRTQPYMQGTLGVTIDASINVDRSVGLNVGIGTIIPNIVTGNNHIFVAPAENSGITIIEENRSSTNSGLVAYATTSYNTGWMHGDIKGAFLSDTDTTNVTGTELVVDGSSNWVGDFDVSADANSWTSMSSATLSVASNELYIQYNGTNSSGAYYDFNVVDGEVYVVSFNGRSSDSAQLIKPRLEPQGSVTFDTGFSSVTNGTLHSSTTTLIENRSSSDHNVNQGYGIQFKAVGTGTVRFSMIANYNASAYLDNVSIRKAELDRSVNNNGLAVYGTITKSAVATGADLVAYSGFSNSNYFEQPHHSGMEVGTGDFYVMGWFKGNSDAYQSPFEISPRNVDTNGVGSILLFIDALSNTFQFYTRNNTSGGWNNGGVSFINDNSTWNFVCCVRRGGVKFVHMNGADGVNAGTHTDDLTETDSIMRLGARSDTSPTAGTQFGAFSGSLSLWRFGQGAPSDEQIKKIYEDEKVLYQENAQATLYGSSDAVTALAYDEVTDQLHVGTSSGRSDFQGLRRINNTTTAVTTAISAHDSFILEQ